MALEEKKAFINDPEADMSTREKNEFLSAKLNLAPHVNRKISSIQRVEIGASGWWIFYRTGSP